MNEHIIKELQKLYPKVKIPIVDEYQFYIDTLLKDNSYAWLPNSINDLKDLYNSVSNITDYKFKKLDILKNYLNEIAEDKGKSFTKILSDLEYFKFDYQKKSFNNWNDRNIYISIDINEANWSVYKKYSGINVMFDRSFSGDYKNKNWQYFLNNMFKVHNSVAKSKSYRQFVLGLTNPKKLAHLQEYEMSIIANELKNVLDENRIVWKSSDEIVIELNDNIESTNLMITVSKDNYKKLDDIIYVINHLNTDIPIKSTIYTVSGQNNFNEFIRIKTTLNENLEIKNKELFGVDGARFFMHFRTLILNESLQENDLLYMNDGYKCKWLI